MIPLFDALNEIFTEQLGPTKMCKYRCPNLFYCSYDGNMIKISWGKMGGNERSKESNIQYNLKCDIIPQFDKAIAL